MLFFCLLWRLGFKKTDVIASSSDSHFLDLNFCYAWNDTCQKTFSCSRSKAWFCFFLREFSTWCLPWLDGLKMGEIHSGGKNILLQYWALQNVCSSVDSSWCTFIAKHAKDEKKHTTLSRWKIQLRVTHVNGMRKFNRTRQAKVYGDREFIGRLICMEKDKNMCTIALLQS